MLTVFTHQQNTTNSIHECALKIFTTETTALELKKHFRWSLIHSGP